jgi:hypothetical protein
MMEEYDIDEVVDELFDCRRIVLEHVGYREQWRDYPLDDARDDYWTVRRGKLSHVGAGDREVLEQWLAAEDAGDDGDISGLYQSEVLSQVNQPGVYRGSVLCVVVADTNTDGNVFLQIFRTDREVASP